MLINDFCGLDFGTSNSTIGIYDSSLESLAMVPLEEGKPTLRSAIFFNDENQNCLLGQKGISAYLSGVPGRLMMSLKSVLGSSLMKEKTYVGSRFVTYTEILGYLIRHIKQTAEIRLGRELNRAILGRPVRFHDNDNIRDKLAEKTLEQVAREQGFKEIYFQYEPIAAALAYEQGIDQEEVALIVDLGGGTSDFSIVRLRSQKHLGIMTGKHFSDENRKFLRQTSSIGMTATHQDRSQDILANTGIHIGGTDFDRLLNLNSVMKHLGLGGRMQGMSGDIEIPSSYHHDLTTWHTINNLYTHTVLRELQSIWNYAYDKPAIARLIKVITEQQGHHIQEMVEQAKCILSQAEVTDLDFSAIEALFTITLSRQQFESYIEDKILNLEKTIAEALNQAQLFPKDINSVFFTGGSTQIPIIRTKIMGIFPNAKIVQGNVFESVGKGLSIDALQRFG